MSKVVYTPIAIRFDDPIIVQGQNRTIPQRHMIIECDSTSHSSFTSVYPTKAKILVPLNGIVKIKLVHSYADQHKRNEYKLTKGFNLRYKVKYYNNNSTIPDCIQTWVIPPPLDLVSYYTEDMVLELPDNWYEIVSINPESEYTLTENLVRFNSTGNRTVIVQPAIGLSDLLVYE
jgi:hypothetical protein